MQSRARLLIAFCLSLLSLFAPESTHAAVPILTNADMPFGCDAKVGNITAELKLVILSQDPAVTIYEGENKIEGVVIRTRITAETTQVHDAVEFVLEYPATKSNNPSNQSDTRVMFSGALHPMMGLDEQGIVYAWKEAYARVGLLGGSEISVSCYSRPIPMGKRDDFF